MRRLPLTIAAGLLWLGCGDDSSSQPPADASSGTTSPELSTGPGPATDSPDTTTEPSTSGIDSSGGNTVCGNGVVEAAEECDDENLLEDDACYSNCTIPYEELWTVTYDGGDDDFGRDASFGPDGSLWVLGASEVAGQGYDVWLRHYGPDGRELLSFGYDGALHGDDYGRGMAWLPDGDLVIVGSETTANADDILVMRVDVSGPAVVWSQTIDGPGMGPTPDDLDIANGVAVDGDGNILVTGTIRVDGQEQDIWLGKLDGDGNELWTLTYDEAMQGDSPDAVLANADGDIYLAGNVQVAANDNHGWLRKLDTDGNELWTITTASGVLFTDAALAPSGNVAIGGLLVPPDAAPDLWVGIFDPEGANAGETSYDRGLYDSASGIAVGSAGDVYVAGFVTVTGQLGEVWAGRYMPNASLRWWQHEYGNADSTLDDAALSIAVSDDESRVAIVGYESVIGQDRNVWIRVLDNRPVPLAQ